MKTQNKTLTTTVKYDGEEYDFKSLGVQLNSISFYCTKECDEAESFFGTCELTGMRGNVVPCIGLSNEGGGVVYFEVLDVFVHGKLGRLAGAF